MGNEVDQVIGPPLPRGEAVRLIFHGLAGIWMKAGEAIVGFHRDNHHPLQVAAYEDGNNIPEYQSPGDLRRHRIELDIVGEDVNVVDSALFFQPTQNFARDPINDDPQDFRWILDFESAEFYRPVFPNGLDKDLDSVYQTQLTVETGIFYTWYKTPARFRLQTETGADLPGLSEPVRVLGNVAEYVAANIYLQAHGFVKLLIDGIEQCRISRGDILFFNDCRKNDNSACDFNPYDLGHKESRNDFYLHYQAINLDDQPEIELILTEPAPKDQQPALRVQPPFDMVANDNAPCAAGGFGGGGGFPPFPPE